MGIFSKLFSRKTKTLTQPKKLLNQPQKKVYTVQLQVVHNGERLPAYIDVNLKAWNRAGAMGIAKNELEFVPRKANRKKK